jgi:hypothetical protein
MSMKAKMALPFAVLVAVGMLAFAGPAMGGGGTTVTIKGPQGDFHGKVNTREPCRAERTVKVFKVREGDDRKIGSDTTGDDGKWSIGNSGFKNGRFYAKVKKTDECEGAKSETIRLVDGEEV